MFIVDEKIIIAIDGPAASGKGTVARKLAKIFNLPHLDSGQLYRHIAYRAIKSAINLNNKSALLELTNKIAFDISEIEDLRNDEISTVASIISQYSEIREQLIEYQRDFASNGAVVDGRDIGTIIFPNADYKFYITASLDQRTERRYLQLKKDNAEIDRNNIKNDINNRDLRDINRKIAPLKKAEDAIEIDTTEMKIDDVIDFIVKYIHKG
ncbi:MAG: cytidylate kinase [Rhodobiaceae bacterium]|nr:cytidylate kinase [Rhodobiaceae bacterium]